MFIHFNPWQSPCMLDLLEDYFMNKRIKKKVEKKFTGKSLLNGDMGEKVSKTLSASSSKVASLGNKLKSSARKHPIMSGAVAATVAAGALGVGLVASKMISEAKRKA